MTVSISTISTCTKALERARQKSWQHRVQVGDVFVSQSGYEQTNVDYYQVIAVNGKNVDLRKINKEVNYAGYQHGVCIPLPDCFISDEVITKKVSQFNTLDPMSCVIKLNSYENKKLLFTYRFDFFRNKFRLLFSND